MDQATCADCGATFPRLAVGASGPSGYAIRWNGERICYPCSDVSERAAFAVFDVFIAYVSGDGKSITTWPGGFLARVTYMSRTSSGFGSLPGRRGSVYTISAIAPDGSEWYGRNAGPGMSIRLRRKKSRRKP